MAIYMAGKSDFASGNQIFPFFWVFQSIFPNLSAIQRFFVDYDDIENSDDHDNNDNNAVYYDDYHDNYLDKYYDDY